MPAGAVKSLVLAAAFALLSVPALAQGTRAIERSPEADYFGFDLRTERDVSLDACEATCLADPECRAFTYNTRAQWCFLKSDFDELRPFPGAVAGRVVDAQNEPDLGAPASLTYVPSRLIENARLYRTARVAEASQQSMGAGALRDAARAARDAGDLQGAVAQYRGAVALQPQDARSWLDLAQALFALAADPNQYAPDADGDGASAAINGYLASRTATERASALATVALGLDRADLYRPALQAYEASLELENDAGIRAALVDLRQRKGFRIVNHTVDAEIASPRLCAQFSENLVRGTDYTSFVTLDGRPTPALDVAERQICVEGLEHGRDYRIVFRSGLPSTVGEVIDSPVSLSIYVRDRAPSVRFGGPNFVLPSAGRHGIPMTSVNAASAQLSLFRIGDRSLARLLSGMQFLRNLDGYDMSTVQSELGTPVWEGEIEFSTELNREVVTSFPVDEALPDRQPGVYVLTAIPEGDTSQTWEQRATQWFIVSDIGLSTFAGEDGLTVFARSLATATPLQGVDLQLLARNNEILGEATTDAQGRATFTAGLLRASDGLAPAVLSAAIGEDDFAFLDMTSGGFDLSDRGVTGRPAPGAVDIFSWTERGIYRAGETAHLAAMARDDAVLAVEDLPLTFVIMRPDGAEDRRLVVNGEAFGIYHLPIQLDPNAMRGTWTARIHTDPQAPAVTQVNFLVEDFVPDRIEFDLTSDTTEIDTDGAATINVDGRYLYGAPAAGLALEGSLDISTTREWARFPGYRFGLADEESQEGIASTALTLPRLDDAGQASFEVGPDALPSTTRLLAADVVVRLAEDGGRAVERRLSLAIRPEGEMIGIRPDFAGDEVRENSMAGFRLIAADRDGNRIMADDASWSLVRIERNYQWYRTGNSWNFEPITVESEIANGVIDISTEGTALTVPVAWGRYRLELASDDPNGPMTSVEFTAGFYVEAQSTETPDGLEIALDRESYAAGDTARLQVSPRFAGELLVTVGSERLLETFTASIPQEGAEIEIPVDEDWGGGAYVTAVLYRPGEAEQGRMPGRAIGVKWLAIDPGARSLDVSLDLEPRSAPRAELVVPVSVTGLGDGEQAYVTVAAVDVGILNLTGYQAPDPQDWYFGQRRMGLELRDLYGRLIDGSAGATGRIRTGGDGGTMALQGSPPTERLVAFFSGPVQLDEEGRADIRFDIPEFNGTVRVMAVAWTRDGVGHASSDVLVRDPVVITAGQPRFLATGDQASIRLDIANTDGPSGDYALTIETQRAAGLSLGNVAEAVALASGGRDTVSVPISANETGDGMITVRLAHQGGIEVTRTLFLPVRPPSMPVTTQQVVTLAPGASVRVDRELLAASLLDGASVAVGVSASSAFDLPSLLMSLDRYPYGCAEQTISRALPLLYVGAMSRLAGLESDPDLSARIADAIARVLTFQSSSGSFGLWGPGFGDTWLDAYITDFLTRAGEQGYTVPAEAMRLALDNLQNSIAYNDNVAESGTQIAYSLYVLARNRRASVGDLRYYADARIDEFTSPMARAQLAAALALYGDAQRSERAFASALNRARSDGGDALNRSDYGSPLRDGAAMLALAAETSPSPSAIPAMVDYVEHARGERRQTSTQEDVWTVLAARAVAEAGSAIRLDIDGAAHEGPFARRVAGETLEQAPLEIANRGDAPVDAVITTVAAPADPLPAGGEGFSIERSYYTLDGDPANVSEVTQNERFVVVLKVSRFDDWPARIALTDLLPAGFEIDNPRLVGSAELSSFEWLGEASAEHAEFRDDRFVAAFNKEQGDASDMLAAYVVRAVTPGIYIHPAAVVEDMYRPQFNARSAEGMMEVMAAR